MRRAALLGPVALLLVSATQPATPLNRETEHVVKPDETLGGVAQRAEVPRILIIEANGLREPYALRAGQRLKLPRTRHHTVKAGETGFSVAYDYGVPWRTIATASGIDSDSAIRPGQKLLVPTLVTPTGRTPRPAPSAPPRVATRPAPTTRPATAVTRLTPPSPFAWPLQGPIRRAFVPRGGRGFHDGIDIGAREGAAVRAAAGGKVIFAQQGPREYGLTVILLHGNRWTTVYSFLGRITVKPGEQVGPGERIGLAGHTGLAKDDQLHFEVRHSRGALNPANYLPSSGSTD